MGKEMVKVVEENKELKQAIETMVNQLENSERVVITGNSIHIGTINPVVSESGARIGKWLYNMDALGIEKEIDTFELSAELLIAMNDMQIGDIEFISIEKNNTKDVDVEKTDAEKFVEYQKKNGTSYNLFNIDWTTGHIENLTIHSNFPNVLNDKYFQRALSYWMFETYTFLANAKINNETKAVDDLKKKLNKAVKGTEEYNNISITLAKAEEKLSCYRYCKEIIENQNSKEDFKTYEINLFKADNFAKIVSFASFASINELKDLFTIYGTEPLIKTLTAYANKVDCGQDAKNEKHACIDTITSIWKHYCTTANDFYTNLNIRCNNSNFQRIWQVCYSGIKRDKNKRFNSDRDIKKNIATIQFEIMGLLVERIQKNIEIEK